MFRSASTGILFLLVFSMLTQGCATVILGSRQDLPVKTVPPDVVARVDDQSCVTPCTLNVPRLSERIYFAGEGDTEKEYPLFKRVNSLEFYFGNILFLLPGAFIGSAVDIQTGAKYTIEPVNIVLPMNGN